MSKYAFKTIIQYLLIYNEFENVFEKTTYNTIAYYIMYFKLKRQQNDKLCKINCVNVYFVKKLTFLYPFEMSVLLNQFEQTC